MEKWPTFIWHITVHLTPGDKEKELCENYGKQIAEKVKQIKNK